MAAGDADPAQRCRRSRMRFDRLRLSGFKSFVEPAELHIRDGLTGIVGPNGCGKSNLLEAIRWVMGESSARSLRVQSGGAGMDEVIFAGTAKRPSRDVAQVVLTLDNRRRTAPAHYNGEDRLEIGREIWRGEGSSYSINGQDVRAKDVQLLFADAATGAHSAALVSQGRVAGIIAAKPQERRLLLEEAAGISGLNVRRKDAETRLRAADANLLRLDDVMRASETQASALRRQAKAAERYRTISTAIHAAEAALLRLQWDCAAKDLAAAENALATATAELSQAVSDAARASAAQANAAAGLPPRRLTEASLAAALQRLSTERATLVAERAAAAQRLADLATALDNAGADEERARARARDSAATQDRLAAERAAAEAAASLAEAQSRPNAEAATAAERSATESERALATAVEAHAALVAEGRSARAQADASAARADRLDAESSRQRRELERLQADTGAVSLDAQVKETEAALDEKSAAARASAQSIEAAERAAQSAAKARDAVEKALSGARSEVASLEAEAAALERLKSGAAPRTRGRVTLSAAPGYEAAVAAAFGDDINAAVGAPEVGAKSERRWLGAAPQSDPALPAAIAPLAAHITAPPELARRIAQVGVVDTPPAAALLASLAVGQRLVSRDGWLWRWDGFVVPPGGQAVAVAEVLAQDNRRREIADAMAAPTARMEAAATELASQLAAHATATDAERRARAARTGVEHARDQLAGRLQGLRAASAQAGARIAAILASIERLSAEGASARAEADAARAAVACLPDTSVAATRVGDTRTAAERARAALAAARAAAAATDRTLAESRARSASLTREIGIWQARDSESEVATAMLANRIEKLRADHIALVGEPAAKDARLHLLAKEIAAAEAARAQAAEAVMTADLELSELDRMARLADARVADTREARATAAARVEQMQSKVAALTEDAASRFGLAPAELAAPEQGTDPDRLEAALHAMSAERERLGIVNLRADIELKEIEETVATQSAEKSELETAIARLRGSIGSLNREGRARLMLAFQQVDGHFRELFVTLFGGGSAELAMIESDDPLDAGLEIRAQPPGKKLQSLSLLSGGEQALTAIALIFGLFLTNPAPICVLDEVDAPLDDANVERFTSLLQHMTTATDTRFLIVTHNAVTMAAMHRLYGVTMSEPGISQLVSVQLAEAEALLAA